MLNYLPKTATTEKTLIMEKIVSLARDDNQVENFIYYIYKEYILKHRERRDTTYICN